MERLSRTESVTKTVASKVQLDNGNVVVVTDYYDDREGIIDTIVNTEDDHVFDDEAMVQEVLDFLDELGN